MMHTSLEESLATTCPVCGHDHHAKFFSLFVGDMHYIIGDCDSCGYRIEFRKDELGAGLFLPDGNVTTVQETFKKEQVSHMQERLAARGEATPVTPGHTALRQRFLDSVPIREERERH